MEKKLAAILSLIEQEMALLEKLKRELCKPKKGGKKKPKGR